MVHTIKTALVAHLYGLHTSQIISSIPRASSLPVRPSTGSPGRHPGALVTPSVGHRTWHSQELLLRPWIDQKLRM
ncbi:hypothetical protein NPIL_160111 [Nephila pilipes]|uniref:Uncharacterized protein n=1 Tax=Nephila pilipes TaxID=299642 RepID=A0A8X6MCF1_NEPPI|nr:hypothetical protein NPIL_160111 [Nephila pilipes]